MNNLRFPVPRWGVPFLEPAALKGIKGGRSSGKSHFVAERIVENHVYDPNHTTVCLREIQKAIKYSSKKLIEDKIKKYNLGHLFKITHEEIRNREGDGIMIFQGLQDHTADSIKSLEGFDDFWGEEAQKFTHRSLQLLIPTFRKDTSEGWFTWNPDQPEDAVERLMPEMLCHHVTYLDNHFCPQRSIDQANRMRATDPDAYDWIWLGGYNTVSEAQIFHGKWVVEDFEPTEAWMPLHGLDWGFSQDPTAAVRLYVENNILWIYQEAVKIGLELDDTGEYICNRIPDMDKYVIRADCARPESISHCKKPKQHVDDKRKPLPLIKGCKKWAGSVEDGIAFIRSFDKVVIHPKCKETIDEFRLYSYKIDPRTGDVTKIIVDKHNHMCDGIRYALGPLISKKSPPRIRTL